MVFLLKSIKNKHFHFHTYYFCHVLLGDEHEMEDEISGEKCENVRTSQPFSEHFWRSDKWQQIILNTQLTNYI